MTALVPCCLSRIRDETKSHSTQRRYGLLGVARVWRVARLTVYLLRGHEQGPPELARKPGPRGGPSDKDLLAPTPGVGAGITTVGRSAAEEDVP